MAILQPEEYFICECGNRTFTEENSFLFKKVKRKGVIYSIKEPLNNYIKCKNCNKIYEENKIDVTSEK